MIEKDSPEWQRLYNQWIEEKRPGYLVTRGGVMYRVLAPSDDDVKFLLEKNEDMYSSRSTYSIGG